MRVLRAGLILALVVAACLPPAGRLFHTTLTSPDPSLSLPVTLGDQTGLVIAIEPGEWQANFRLEPLIEADPDDPDAFIVSWLGGMCDQEAVLSFRPSGPDYSLHLEIRDRIGFGACPALGVQRAVRVRTSVPIPIGRIYASGRG